METVDLTQGQVRRAFIPSTEPNEPMRRLSPQQIPQGLYEKLHRYCRVKGLKINRVVAFALHQYLN